MALVMVSPAYAETLRVGPDQAFQTPSAAARSAQDGDRVEIAAGTYFDCAIWTANNLVIEGIGDGGAVMTDKPCEGKAAFIVRGHGMTIRNMTFTRIRVLDRNGAGIRIEGTGLVVEHSRFINNQIGLLAGDAPTEAVRVEDCDFSSNGLSDSADGTADLLVGRVALLRVAGSRIGGGKGGAVLSSAAFRTELAGNRIETGGTMTPSYALGALAGGELLMNDNVMTLGAKGAPRQAAVLVAQDGGVPTGALVLRRTQLINETGASAVLLRNWGNATPVLAGNNVQPGDIEMTDDGALLHRAKQAVHEALAWLHQLMTAARHLAAMMLHRVRP
jgi:hypothetical protein